MGLLPKQQTNSMEQTILRSYSHSATQEIPGL